MSEQPQADHKPQGSQQAATLSGFRPLRPLDCLVAEKLFGWTWQRHPERPDKSFLMPAGSAGYPRLFFSFTKPDSWIDEAVPQFLSDIAAAWLLVTAMRTDGAYLELLDLDMHFQCRFWSIHPSGLGIAVAASASEAITLAALRFKRLIPPDETLLNE